MTAFVMAEWSQVVAIIGGRLRDLDRIGRGGRPPETIGESRYCLSNLALDTLPKQLVLLVKAHRRLEEELHPTQGRVWRNLHWHAR
jgi:hypothetical protein